MSAPCKKIRYKSRRSSKPIIRIKKPPPSISSFFSNQDDLQPIFFTGEGAGEELPLIEKIIPQKKTTIQLIKEWVHKQRFIPQDLSDEFLALFLSAAGFNVDSAAEQIKKYFYSRQEPSFLFRNRDPLSPENMKIFKKLYVLPIPETTPEGSKVILTGLVEPTVTYSQLEHAKILALVFDILIWEKDFGFGDFIVVLDGMGFECPHLLENNVPNHKSITSLLLDTIPGTLRSFYFLNPPPHVANVANNRNGIWITVVKRPKELSDYLPADFLPLEFGGNLGRLGDILEQWNLHLAQTRDFFIHFEKKMINDYRRRLCHDKEVAEGGKNWISRMKLVEDEWEYKIKYYERMKNMKPLKHPAFGSLRMLSMIKQTVAESPLYGCRKRAKQQAEEAKIFEPPKLYNGYAKELRKAKMLEETERLKNLPVFAPVLELQIQYI